MQVRAMLLLCLSCLMPMSVDAACNAPEHRQFDFWIGDWDVVAPAGAPNAGAVIGHNRIEKVAAGCALSESWRGASGLEGRSLNTYDASARQWRQFWIGGDGVLLQLAGAIQDGQMHMEGVLPTASGGLQRQRIVWTPHPDGSVTQRWDTSEDGGETWSPSFVGLYRRRTP